MDHKVQLSGDYSYYCENKLGSNYAMVGDAGAFLDPIFSSGIFVGMYSAELVSDALHKKLTLHDDQALSDTYQIINGALGLIEKFIQLFYNPEIINFSKIGHPEKLLQYKETEAIYTIFHYLLSGDFFKNHKKYSDFIDTMYDKKMLAKFQSLINYSTSISENATCKEVFEEIYGEVSYQVNYDESLF